MELCLVSSASWYRFAFKHSSRASSPPKLSFIVANFHSHSIGFPACSASALYPLRSVAVLALSPFIKNQFASDGLESTHSGSLLRTEFDFAQFYYCEHAPALSECFLILFPFWLSSLDRP
jgi:hypothetical protein